MFLTATQVLSVLEHYRYLLIFPIAIIEGPIITIITGFLVYLKYLNFITAFLILVSADMIGDCLYYTIGRFWRKWTWIKKYARYLGYKESSEAFLEEHFSKHKGKTFLLAKISHGIGGAIQIASGVAQVNFRDFIFYSFIGTIPKTLVLMLVGYYLGSSYIKINGFFDKVGLITLFVAIILVSAYIFINKYTKKFFDGGQS